jgi:hypothetical protein
MEFFIGKIFEIKKKGEKVMGRRGEEETGRGGDGEKR